MKEKGQNLPFLRLAIFALIAVCVIALTLAGYFLFHLNLWLCLGMSLAAVLLNGLFATWEDEQPGGFKPYPDKKPDQKH